MRLVLVGSTLLMGVGLSGIGASVSDSIRPANVRTIRLEEVPPCQEDQACWDCATMGNGICGLTPTEDAAELAESRTHNGTTELPATN